MVAMPDCEVYTRSWVVLLTIPSCVGAWPRSFESAAHWYLWGLGGNGLRAHETQDARQEQRRDIKDRQGEYADRDKANM